MSKQMNSDLGFDPKTFTEVDCTVEASAPINEDFGVNPILKELSSDESEKVLSLLMGEKEIEKTAEEQKKEQEEAQVVRYPLGYTHTLRYPINYNGVVIEKLIFSKPLEGGVVLSISITKLDDLSIGHVLALVGHMTGTKPIYLAKLITNDIFAMAPVAMSFLVNGHEIG